MDCCFFFSSRRRQTRCALVTGVHVCSSDLSIFQSGKIAIGILDGGGIAVIYQTAAVGVCNMVLLQRRAHALLNPHRPVAVIIVVSADPVHAERARRTFRAGIRRKRSEEPTSELQSLISNSYAVFRL